MAQGHCSVGPFVEGAKDWAGEPITWVCVEPHIGRALGRSGLYKHVWGAPKVTGHFGSGTSCDRQLWDPMVERIESKFI